MKILIHILCIYILFLTVFPCTDEHPSKNKGLVSIEMISSHSEEESYGAECSPFCLCSCCGISHFFFVSIEIIPDEYLTIGNLSKSDLYKSVYQFQFLQLIWSPPK